MPDRRQWRNQSDRVEGRRDGLLNWGLAQLVGFSPTGKSAVRGEGRGAKRGGRLSVQAGR